MRIIRFPGYFLVNGFITCLTIEDAALLLEYEELIFTSGRLM